MRIQCKKDLVLKIKHSCCNQWLDLTSQKVAFGAETHKSASSKWPTKKTLPEAKQPYTWKEICIQDIEREKSKSQMEKQLFGFDCVLWCFFFPLWALPPMLFYNNTNWFGRNTAAMNKGQTVGSSTITKWHSWRQFLWSWSSENTASKIIAFDDRVGQKVGQNGQNIHFWWTLFPFVIRRVTDEQAPY